MIEPASGAFEQEDKVKDRMNPFLAVIIVICLIVISCILSGVFIHFLFDALMFGWGFLR